VLRVLANAGAPVVGAVPYEACTPTGAAIIAAAATGFGSMPEMVVERIGVGAGGRDPQERANLLRLVIGHEVPQARRTGAAHVHRGGHEHHEHAAGHKHEHAPVAAHHDHGHGASAQEHSAQGTAAGAKPVVIETNVDDLDPRLWPAALAALLAAGASDAWLTPILMKKGRPAHTVHVLCRPEMIDAVRSALVRHTTTIGMRSYEIEKYALERQYTHVSVDGHEIGVKIALERGEVVNASVEYEDAAAAATALSRPLKVVIAQATALAAEQY
jgi:pyridinium-3,5-bisthiocarboxylic acid mononucleotide nickel chelatase